MSTELENLVEIDILLEDAKLLANEMMDRTEPNSRERARAAVDIHQILSEAFRLHKLHGTTQDQRDKLRELANIVINSGFGLHHGAYPAFGDSTTPGPNLSGVVSRGEGVSAELCGFDTIEEDHTIEHFRGKGTLKFVLDREDMKGARIGTKWTLIREDP